MKVSIAGFLLIFFFFMGCGDSPRIFREQKLPSGKVVKIASVHLVWGSEHEVRYPGNDCFALEFVSSKPQADPSARQQEAREVFELIRPLSEQWGFDHASLAGVATTQGTGPLDTFVFSRSPGGPWSCSLYPASGSR